jgi:hypothetical protein
MFLNKFIYTIEASQFYMLRFHFYIEVSLYLKVLYNKDQKNIKKLHLSLRMLKIKSFGNILDTCLFEKIYIKLKIKRFLVLFNLSSKLL